MLTNLKTLETKSTTALEKFSSNRVLISKFIPAVVLLKGLLKELKIGTGTFSKVNLLIQNKVEFEDGLSDTEARALIDMGEISGCINCKLYYKTKELTIEEALYELESD